MRPRLLTAYASKLSREWGRPVTRPEAEADIVRTIRAVAASLGRRFVFGYHTREDVEQQVALYALEALAEPGRYDASRPLGNFLYVHCKNRLRNLKRDTLARRERPCDCCDPFGPPPAPCRRWSEWADRNTSKQAIMNPESIGDWDRAVESDASGEAVVREAVAKIDAELDPELRSDYLRMRDRVHVPRGRRHRVREAIREILGSE